MTDNIKELEEKLRIAKEEKFLSEGGFKCIRCGKLSDSKYKFSEEKVQPFWVIDLKEHPDPSLDQMCNRCAMKQFRSLKNEFFEGIESNPNQIEVVKIELGSMPHLEGNMDIFADIYDHVPLFDMVLKIGDKFFRIEREYDCYNDDSEIEFRFIGREGDDNINESMNGVK